MAIDLKGTKWRALRRDENGAQRIASFGTKKAVTENQITASINHVVGGIRCARGFQRSFRLAWCSFWRWGVCRIMVGRGE